MKSIFLKVFISIVVITTAFSTLHAQEIINVSGKILYLAEGKNNPIPFPIIEKVYVFSFYTVEAAKDALRRLEMGEKIISEAIEIADYNGYYKIPVTENGALIVHAAMKNELIEVKGRNVINCNIESNMYAIDFPMEITPKPRPKAGKFKGTKFIVNNSIAIPEGYGGTNKRLILRPFLIDCQTDDTIKKLIPIVVDGKRYRQKNDSYAPFVDRRRWLTEERFNIDYCDTIELADPRRNYTVICNIVVKNKYKIVYENNLKLTTCKVKRPFMFLEPVDTTNQSLKEACCLGMEYGFDYRNALNMKELKERKIIFELVKNSSPINHAVLCMSMETPSFDKEAKEVLDKMEQTTQVKYMKLQLFIRDNRLFDDPKLVEPFSSRESYFKEACKMLDSIIKEDPKFRRIAENDGEITPEFMDYFADPFNWDDSLIYVF